MNAAIAERARAGELLTPAELDELATVDVLTLGMLADDVRRARCGDTVTFVRVSDTSMPGSPAEFRLGALPETIEQAEAMIAEARTRAGTQRLTGFSLADIVSRNWDDLSTVLRRLKRAGLDAIVDAPVDRVADVSVFRTAQEAGLPVRCLSLQKPVNGRTEYILTVRSILQAVPSIDAVAPLPKEQSITVPTTGYDDVRAIALTRLGVPSLKTIEIDWSQYGPKLAQVALAFGANHLDRVSTADDESLGRRRTAVEDVRRNIVAAGFSPVEVSPGL